MPSAHTDVIRERAMKKNIKIRKVVYKALQDVLSCFFLCRLYTVDEALHILNREITFLNVEGALFKIILNEKKFILT